MSYGWNFPSKSPEIQEPVFVKQKIREVEVSIFINIKYIYFLNLHVFGDCRVFMDNFRFRIENPF